MSSGGCNRGPVKVVIINTQYVETDATSFKSVVQKLTGKDSEILEAVSENGQKKRHDKHNVEVPSAGDFGRSFLMRDVSFKELDRLLSEMPTINNLWAD
ncbi:VQ motif-containing protein 1-like [Cajanus cajan]|uniref:VQ motif-containing protein 1-like n=1 Tax=Cajanus cajan TaxID=3821 RepID=UPI00098D963F|nr:VQ motif-containing protein 1-like [Cajanus cajan]